MFRYYKGNKLFYVWFALCIITSVLCILYDCGVIFWQYKLIPKIVPYTSLTSIVLAIIIVNKENIKYFQRWKDY